ncbi:unnamed protein product [Eruca vesicaria subsp. sativa]|uniref:SNF2 N-terminal domain-containing protein n=1 Tax=Eruca vesicaria subsp. sativa TaxID=29727 RepID=A0ABC8ISL6_ERUVS|nr:unnamed protein product [Eruca vesicaria subsp. sativa]
MPSKGWCLDHENIFMLLPFIQLRSIFLCREFGITVTKASPSQRSLLTYIQISSRHQCTSRRGTVPPLFILKRYLCGCIYVESNLQIEQMGLGKTLQAISFFTLQDFLSQIPWQYAVIDEAQIPKDPNSVVSLGKFIEFLN